MDFLNLSMIKKKTSNYAQSGDVISLLLNHENLWRTIVENINFAFYNIVDDHLKSVPTINES